MITEAEADQRQADIIDYIEAGREAAIARHPNEAVPPVGAIIGQTNRTATEDCGDCGEPVFSGVIQNVAVNNQRRIPVCCCCLNVLKLESLRPRPQVDEICVAIKIYYGNDGVIRGASHTYKRREVLLAEIAAGEDLVPANAIEVVNG